MHTKQIPTQNPYKQLEVHQTINQQHQQPYTCNTPFYFIYFVDEGPGQ